AVEREGASAVGDGSDGDIQVPRSQELLARPPVEDDEGPNVLACAQALRSVLALPPAPRVVTCDDEDPALAIDHLARGALGPVGPDLPAPGQVVRDQAAAPVGADQVVLPDVALARAGDLPARLRIEVETPIDVLVAGEQLPPIGPRDEAVRRVEEAAPGVALVDVLLAAEPDLARGGIEDGEGAVGLDEREPAGD